MNITIGARKSQLALVQCKQVAGLLANAGAEVELVPVDTVVDSLEVGLKEGATSPVFVKEVDEALLRGDIDVAVQDLKDVGAALPAGISIAAVTAREDAAEAFVSTKASKLQVLPAGSRLGVTSQSSHVQLARLYPAIDIVPMPSDIEMLLLALKKGELDAFMTPACDLKRLGFTKLIAETMPLGRIIPAIGQGALAAEVRGAEKDLLSFVSRACHHRATGLRVRAERAFMKALGGFEGAVFAAHAEIKPKGLAMIGFLATTDGQRFVAGKESGDLDRAAEVGAKLAEKLVKKFGT
jgi:hydroxymethylbilane synthase